MSKLNKLAGICLILATLTVFAAIMVRSDHSQINNAEMFADVEASRTPELISAALFVLGAILFVPAGLGIARLARGRGATLTYAGAFLLTLGGMWFATGRAVSNVWLYAATSPDLPRDQALTAYEQLASTPAFVIWLPLLLAFITAPIVLGLGLWKMGLVPIWVAPAWVVSLGSFLAVEGTDIGEFVGFGLMTAVLCWMGLAVIRYRGSGWEHAFSTAEVDAGAQPRVQ